MNSLNCFYEYEAIKNSEVLAAVKSNKALQEFFTHAFDGVKASQYCGILNIEGNDYYILPKITTDEQHNLDTFIYMLMYAYDIEIKNEDLSGSANQKHRLFQLLINIFTKKLLHQLQVGLYREYITFQDNLTTLRGKYLINENLKYNITHQKIYCEYDEFSLDNPLNRFFLYAVKYLLPYAENKKELRLIEAIFDETSYRHFDLHRSSSLTFNRLNVRYQQSVDSGMLLLKHLIPLFAKGKQSFAFLFDMNELFEKFIGKIFVDIESKTLLQNERNFGNLKLIPDIVMPGMIVDTKYKRVRDRQDISAADKYQMFAYGKNFGIRKTMLLYPKHLEDVDEDLVLGKDEDAVELKMRSVDLDFDGGYEKYIDKMRLSMKEIL
jgi:5-methylcytosine-specific restriction enzyme subunit McrC